MIKLENSVGVALPGHRPMYSPYGYWITPDGTIYALMYAFWHGAVLALLYPDVARDAGYILPDTPDDVDVFLFQNFELDYSKTLPVVRISGTRLGYVTIDRGSEPATQSQVTAVQQVVKLLGLQGYDTVMTDRLGEIPIHELYDYLTSDNS